MKRGRLLCAAVIATAFGAIVSDTGHAVAPPPHPTTNVAYYSVVDLGLGVATAINERGRIVGAIEGSGPLIWPSEGFLSMPAGLVAGIAESVNNLGTVVGSGLESIGMDYESRGLVWRGSQVTELPSLGSFGTLALGVNDRGVIVGAASDFRDVSAPDVERGFVLQHGVVTYINPQWQTYSLTLVPLAISDSGVIVGQYGPRGAYLLEQILPNSPLIFTDDQYVKGPHAFVTHLAAPQDFSDLPAIGFSSLPDEARAVNQLGEIAGASYVPSSHGAVLHAAAWIKGTPVDLGAEMPASWGNSAAEGLDDNGDVVGTAGATDSGAFSSWHPPSSSNTTARAVLWHNGRASDLNTLIKPVLHWRLAVATAINNGGVIVGGGFVDGDQSLHAFKLVPRSRLVSLQIAPSTVSAGHQSDGIVTLSLAPPPGGATVALTSTFSRPNPAADVPQTVTVPAGEKSFTFPITTVAVHGSITGTVTATFNGKSRSAKLTVQGT